MKVVKKLFPYGISFDSKNSQMPQRPKTKHKHNLCHSNDLTRKTFCQRKNQTI